MKTKEIKIKKAKFIPFPCPEYEFFAESFVVQDDILYFPLNSIKHNGALYSYNKKKYKKLFDFRKDDFVFGSKIYNKEIFVCALTKTETVMICDLKNGDNRRDIHIGVMPNDLCIYKNTILCGANVTTNMDCGIIISINIDTQEQTTIIKEQNLNVVCGINVHDGKIFVASFNKISVFDADNYLLQSTVTNNVDCPLYDNITIRNNTLYIATFMQAKLLYNIIDNKQISAIIYKLLVATGLAKIPNQTNLSRQMNETKVSFVKLKNNVPAYCAFDKLIHGFDGCTTEMIRINNHTFSFVNYKADGFLLVYV
jgi:outer membrane protein assembly factor BamB